MDQAVECLQRSRDAPTANPTLGNLRADLLEGRILHTRGGFEAGSFRGFTLTYTAGTFGIDDTGSLKIVHRFASDMGRPQFDTPAAPNYVTADC